MILHVFHEFPGYETLLVQPDKRFFNSWCKVDFEGGGGRGSCAKWKEMVCALCRI